MRNPSFRFFPSGAEIVEYPEAGVTVGLHQSPHTPPVPYAIGYAGKSNKPIFNFRFKSFEQRETFIKGKVEQIAYSKKAHAERMAARKAARKEFTHTVKVGEIFHTSWGYDQTNSDFFQVTRVISGKSVEVRKVADITTETGFMCGDSVAQPNRFVGEPKRCLVRGGYGGGDTIINIDGNEHDGYKGGKNHTSWYA